MNLIMYSIYISVCICLYIGEINYSYHIRDGRKNNNPTTSIITLNVNHLNACLKDRFSEWIKKHRPNICCLKEIHFTYRDKYRWKVKEWRKIDHAKNNQKKAGLVKLILDRAEFKARKAIRDKEGHPTMINGSFLQEHTIINTYSPNKVSNYVRKNKQSWKKNRWIHYQNWRLHHHPIRNRDSEGRKSMMT